MPTENPLISVVMPCYNCAPCLAEAVGSVLRQTHGNVELILVDDGSTDESPNIEPSFRMTTEHRLRAHLIPFERAAKPSCAAPLFFSYPASAQAAACPKGG